MSVASAVSRFRLFQARRLRRRPLRTVLSIVGIASGVALVIAVAALLTSVSATAKSVTQLIQGSSYEVVHPGGFDEDAIRELSAVPGVDGLARSVNLPVLIDGESGWLIAVEPATELAGTAALLSAVDGVRVGAQVSSNGKVRLTGFDGRTTEVAVDGQAETDLRDQLGGRFIATPLEDAIKLSGLGLPSSLLIFGTGVERDLLVAAGGNGASVQTAADKVSFAEGALAPIASSLSLFALMGALVGGALVFNTVNANALDNRNETALLRALGSDRGSARLGVMAEGLLIGLAGSLLGTILGLVVGAAVVDTVPDAFSNLVGSPIELVVPWWLPVLAFVVGIGLSILSTLGPVRAAGRIDPIEGIRQTEAADLERVHISWFKCSLGAAILLLSVVLRGGLGLVSAVVGSLILLRALAPTTTWLVAAVAARLGSPGRLASLAVARAPQRVWSMILVLLMSVSISLMSVGALSDFMRTSEADVSTVGQPSFWISTVSGDNVPMVGLPVEWLSDIEAMEGVTDVAATRLITTGFSGKQVGVLGVLGESSYSYYALASDEAKEQVQSGDGVVVNRQFADTFDVAEGDRIPISAATPERLVTVAAVTEGLAVAEGGLVVVSAEVLDALYGVNSFASFEVTTTPEASDEVQVELATLVSGAGQVSVHVIPSAQFLDDALISIRQISAVIGVILIVIAICAGIAVVNTFAAVVVSRKREFAMLRAIGSTRTQIRRSVVAEAAAIGVVAGVLGAVLGSYLHYLTSLALSGSFHLEYRFSIGAVAASVLLGVVIALLGSWLPIRRGTTDEVIESLSFE